MQNQYHMAENLRDYELPVDLHDLGNTAINGIMALATRAANSNRCSNSLGGASSDKVPAGFEGVYGYS